jgi:predicted nucleic acid-binding protein
VRAALDTNVLAYAEGVDGRARRDAALNLLRRLPQEGAVLPVQVLGELFNVLIRKAGRSHHDARDSVLAWRDAFPLVETSPDVLLAAADLATDHRLGIWDAVVFAATSKAGCRVLLSEDLQEGFTWGGVTVVNPFASRRHPLLHALLAADPG